MPLREDILVPIPGENPSGVDLRYDPKLLIFDNIKEARRQDDELAQGAWQRERKTANYALEVKLAQDALATTSKDLQLAAYLTEGLLQTEGFAGLRQGLNLTYRLLTEFWDTVYPIIEDGDREFRARPLSWIGSFLALPLRSAPLVSEGYSWFVYKDSRVVGYEDQLKTDKDRKTRAKLIEDGKIGPEVFDKAFAETPTDFYLKAEKDLDGCLQALESLEKFCNENFEDDAPTFGKLKTALTEVRHTIHSLLNKKREREFTSLFSASGSSDIATVVRVFYATDRREVSSSEGDVEYSVGRSLSGQIHYGECHVSIPTSHKLGRLESPSFLKLEFRKDPNKHIVLAKTDSIEVRPFFERVSASVAKSRARDAFVFIHGYNVSFEDAARRTGQIAFDLQFVGAPIFYSWPSHGKLADYVTGSDRRRRMAPSDTHTGSFRTLGKAMRPPLRIRKDNARTSDTAPVPAVLRPIPDH
jgi:type VI secretion system ImpA family protein